MKIKTIIFILFVVALTGISPTLKSQDFREDKQSRKEAKKQMLTYNFYVLDSLLVSRRYVLEADYLQNKIGDRISVSNTINFVRVNEEEGVLQTGSDMLVGSNGFGGVTTGGNISQYKIHRNLKSLTHRVSFNLVSNLGVFNIDMSIRADNFASATITSTRSGRLTWQGHLASLNHTRTFKGMDLY